MKVNDILDDLELGTCLLWEDIDFDICEEYISFFGETQYVKEQINVDNFKKLQVYHNEKLKEINIKKYEEERFKKVLEAAKVEGQNFTEKNNNYEEALSIALKR